MATPLTFRCKYCGSARFQSKRALSSHLRTSFCKHRREAEIKARNPARAALFQDEPLEDDFGIAMGYDDIPPPIAPSPPRKKSTTRAVIQEVDVHDVGEITMRISALLDETGSAEEDSEDELETMIRAQTGMENDSEEEESDFEKEDSEAEEEEAVDEEEKEADDPEELSNCSETGVADEWIRGQFWAYCAKAKTVNKPFTEHEVTSIKLMQLLKEKNAPLNTYDSVMLWYLQQSKELYPFQTLRDYQHFIGRKTMLKRLIKRYNFQDKMPYQKKIQLPVSGTTVNLTLHDTRAAIQRLLTDPRIDPDDYLFFEPGKPLAPPPEKLEFVQDLNTGRAFLDTYAHLIAQNGREALMPVVIYFDGTAVSHFHNMEIIHVNIALGTMTRLARNKPFCWAPLGCIEKISEQGGRGREILAQANHLETQDGLNSEDEGEDSGDDANAPVVKMPGVGDKPDQDFHAMMACVLEGLVELQAGGFLWDHHDPVTGEDTPDIHYKIFVPFLKVDGKEADLACGKYQNRANTQQICRKCHIPLARADDHLAKPKLKTVAEIKKLIDNADLDGLKALSQTYLQNAFYNVRFSTGNKQGVHGSCPSELLHAFLLGTFKYIRDVFFEVIGKTSEGARKINALAKVYGKLFLRQSDRTMPGTFFTRGIQQGKLMAKDYRGVLLLMLAIVRSTKGREILKGQQKSTFRDEGDTTLDDWILLVELMLEWESYMNEPKMQVKHVKRLKKKHRYIMYIMRKVAQRTEGMGLKLSKFHTILHIWEDILQFGVPLEYDTSANESFHKPTKGASKMTQKATDTFNYQTALRLAEFFVIELAIEELTTGRRVWEYYNRKDSMPKPQLQDSENQITTGDTQILVFHDEETGENAFDLRTQSKNRAQTRWNPHIVDFLEGLQALVLPTNQQKSLPIYTAHRRNGQIFRGHPNYRGKGPWKDWVWIDWGTGFGRVVSHIWCFVRLEGMPTGRNHLAYGGIRLKDGVFAVVETAEEEDSPIQSDLMTPVLKQVELDDQGTMVDRTFYLADTEAFLDPACVIPDLGGPPNRYFVVKPRNQWAAEFVKWVQDEHSLDTMDIIFDSEEEQSSDEEVVEEADANESDMEAEEEQQSEESGSSAPERSKRRRK